MLLDALDEWDPNNWEVLFEPSEFRIYADDHAGIYAVVDEVDYHHCIQYRWKPLVSRGGKKVYLCRSVHYTAGPDVYVDGRRYQRRHMDTHFLHTEVMERTGIPQPSINHKLTDHADGNGLNCRRYNLSWATHSMNRRNTNGKAAKQKGLFI